MSDTVSGDRSDKSAFEAAMNSLDIMPHSALVLNDSGILVYKNSMAVRYMPRVKEGSNVARYSGLNLSRNYVKLMEFYGKTALITVAKKPIGGKDYIIVFVYPSMVGSNERAAKYFESKSDHLAGMMLKRLDAILTKTPNDECRAYIRFLLKNRTKINACRGLVKKYLYNINCPTENADESCFIAPVLSRFKTYIEDGKNNFLLRVNVDCPPNASCILSCYDLSYMLVCIACFTVVFTKSKTIDIRVRENDDGVDISASVKIRYYVFRMLSDAYYDGKPEQVSNLFYSLQTVNVLANISGCKVSYTENGDVFNIVIHTKFCAGLPNMPKLHTGGNSDNGLQIMNERIQPFLEELSENIPDDK